VTDRGGGCLVIGNDGGGGKEMVRSSGGRPFQRRGAPCSDGYGSVGEHEMKSDRGSRKGETGC